MAAEANPQGQQQHQQNTPPLATDWLAVVQHNSGGFFAVTHDLRYHRNKYIGIYVPSKHNKQLYPLLMKNAQAKQLLFLHGHFDAARAVGGDERLVVTDIKPLKPNSQTESRVRMATSMEDQLAVDCAQCNPVSSEQKVEAAAGQATAAIASTTHKVQHACIHCCQHHNGEQRYAWINAVIHRNDDAFFGVFHDCKQHANNLQVEVVIAEQTKLRQQLEAYCSNRAYHTPIRLFGYFCKTISTNNNVHQPAMKPLFVTEQMDDVATEVLPNCVPALAIWLRTGCTCSVFTMPPSTMAAATSSVARATAAEAATTTTTPESLALQTAERIRQWQAHAEACHKQSMDLARQADAAWREVARLSQLLLQQLQPRTSEAEKEEEEEENNIVQHDSIKDVV